MDQLIVASLLSVALISHIVFVSIREARYQRAIDRLTDRLMAKDYSEYKRNENVTQPVETKTRKKVSFYDDPSIEIDEDSVN